MKEIIGFLLLLFLLTWVVAYPPHHERHLEPPFGQRIHHISSEGVHHVHHGPDGLHTSHTQTHYHDTRIHSGHHNPQSSAKTYGRKTKYTLKHPAHRGHTKVMEMHVEMDREMHPHEAEHTMKKIMTSMSDHRNNFRDFVKSMGFNFH